MEFYEQLLPVMQPLADFLSSGYGWLQSFAGSNVANLMLIAIGIATYAIIVGIFYKKLSKRELFTRDMNKHAEGFGGAFQRLFSWIWFLVKYAAVFPVISFLWFLFLSLFLFLLSRTQAVASILLVSIAIVIAIRITAYIDEDIAVDLAKMLPLAMLGVFLTDPTVYSEELLKQRLLELGQLIPSSLEYFYVMILIELPLRVIFGSKRKASEEEEEQETGKGK
ncbi:MAG: hypothetical protein ABIG96_04660 [Candidatus Micrarchaeota archaeon]